MNLSDIFRGATGPALSDTETARLVDLAAAGDNAAFLTLAATYGPLLRGEAKRVPATQTDTEEAQQAVIVGFWSAIRKSAETGTPFGAAVARYGIRPALAESTAATADRGPSVPPAVARDVARAMRKATAALPDTATRAEVVAYAEGIACAPRADKGRRMAPADFRAALDATALAPVALDDPDDPEATKVHDTYAADAEANVSATLSPAERAVLAARALDAMTDRQQTVCRMSYGFGDDGDACDPLPDAEIAHRLGGSRQSVQQARARGIDRARAALGVDVPDAAA